jgi:hypothetical protein
MVMFHTHFNGSSSVICPRRVKGCCIFHLHTISFVCYLLLQKRLIYQQVNFSLFLLICLELPFAFSLTVSFVLFSSYGFENNQTVLSAISVYPVPPIIHNVRHAWF